MNEIVRVTETELTILSENFYTIRLLMGWSANKFAYYLDCSASTIRLMEKKMTRCQCLAVDRIVYQYMQMEDSTLPKNDRVITRTMRMIFNDKVINDRDIKVFRDEVRKAADQFTGGSGMAKRSAAARERALYLLDHLSEVRKIWRRKAVKGINSDFEASNDSTKERKAHCGCKNE